MRLTRIHVDAALAPGAHLPLPAAAARHLLRVLRLREGDGCILFNGDGQDYPARIVEGGQHACIVEIIDGYAVHTESPLQLWLVQALARGEKMDFIVQKATELGVHGIIPLISERSEVKLDAARTDKRLAHWRSVILSACEQSGRARVPYLHAPVPLAQVQSALPADMAGYFLAPDADASLASMRIPEEAPVAFAVGPEGGWSPHDRQGFEASGFSGVRLGPRILRTETAGLAALAIAQARGGDG